MLTLTSERQHRLLSYNREKLVIEIATPDTNAIPKEHESTLVEKKP